MSHLLDRVDHRPFPLPAAPWIMTQQWRRLLFAHWPFAGAAAETIRRLIPEPLEPDLFDGNLYVAVVPFEMYGVRFRFMPAVPGLSRFLELNVRTYVRFCGMPGVYFFSLDCSNPLAVEAARLWFNLPYLHASMSLDFDLDQRQGWYHYVSTRSDGRAAAAALDVRYRPLAAEAAPPGVHRRLVEQFLTERYRLYTVRNGRVTVGNIHHHPWPLQPAEADFTVNEMLSPLGVRPQDAVPTELNPEGGAILHYSHAIDTLEWSPVLAG